MRSFHGERVEPSGACGILALRPVERLPVARAVGPGRDPTIDRATVGNEAADVDEIFGLGYPGVRGHIVIAVRQVVLTLRRRLRFPPLGQLRTLRSPNHTRQRAKSTQQKSAQRQGVDKSHLICGQLLLLRRVDRRKIVVVHLAILPSLLEGHWLRDGLVVAVERCDVTQRPEIHGVSYRRDRV